MSREQVTVVVIGGGSSYTPELVEGLIKRHSEFPVHDLFLVDIEAGRRKLEIVGALAKRMIERARTPIRVHLTFNREQAIRGADYVITQFRVGMLDARARDERIPLAYNRIGQETTGAGGFAKALRTIPVILEICRDIERLAPDALLINFTNPAGLITEAVLKHTKVQAIGLCNLPIGTKMQIAKSAGVEVGKVEIENVGLNHLNWTTRAYVDGRDVTAEILQHASGQTGWTMKNIPHFGWDSTFLQSVGALPCSYLRYYYMEDEMLQEELQAAASVGTRAEVVKAVERDLFGLYEDESLSVKPPQLEQRGGAYYSEAALDLITSFHNNRKDLQIVNVKNGQTLPFLTCDVVVETKCVIDAQGAHPIQLTQPVPAHLRGLIQAVKAYEELAVEAAVTGSYSVALQALTTHPLVRSAAIARALLDDILEQHQEYLPQFQSLG